MVACPAGWFRPTVPLPSPGPVPENWFCMYWFCRWFTLGWAIRGAPCILIYTIQNEDANKPRNKSKHTPLYNEYERWSRLLLPGWGLLPLEEVALPFDPLAAAFPPEQTDSFLHGWEHHKNGCNNMSYTNLCCNYQTGQWKHHTSRILHSVDHLGGSCWLAKGRIWMGSI